MSSQSHVNLGFGSSAGTPPAADMAKQQTQAIYDKLDKAQYFLDKAADIIYDLKTDKDVHIVEQAHPWTKLQQHIGLTEQRIDHVSDDTMAQMLSDLKKAGAKEFTAAPKPASQTIRPSGAAQSVERASSPNFDVSRYETELFRSAVSGKPTTTGTLATPMRLLANAGPSTVTATPLAPNQIPVLAQPYLNRPSIPSNLSLHSKGNTIPVLKDDLTAADKMLMEWKAEGRTWADIKDQYERLNGGKRVGNSTLPNRYARLKAAFES